MRSRRFSKVSLFTMLFALLSMADAQARSDTAVHGYVRPADRACFQESWGSMLNTCATTRQLFIPASIDKHCISGSSFKVTAQSNNTSSNVCCRVIAMNGTGVSVTPWACLPAFGSPQQMNLGGAPLWWERLFYVCDVGANAKVYGIDYSPNGDC